LLRSPHSLQILLETQEWAQFGNHKFLVDETNQLPDVLSWLCCRE
jgi:hypothetical protein